MCFSSQSSVSRPISRARSIGSSKSPNGDRSLGRDGFGCAVVVGWGAVQRFGTLEESDGLVLGFVDEEDELAPKVNGVVRAGLVDGLSASMTWLVEIDRIGMPPAKRLGANRGLQLGAARVTKRCEGAAPARRT